MDDLEEDEILKVFLHAGQDITLNIIQIQHRLPHPLPSCCSKAALQPIPSTGFEGQPRAELYAGPAGDKMVSRCPSPHNQSANARWRRTWSLPRRNRAKDNDT